MSTKIEMLAVLSEIQQEEMEKAEKAARTDLDRYINRYLDFSEMWIKPARMK